MPDHNTRAPSLRDMIDPFGNLNGALMHDGSLTTLRQVVEHYNAVAVTPGGNNLDVRTTRRPSGTWRWRWPRTAAELDEAEKDAIVAFMETLGGTNVYSDERWSDPFRN